MTPGSFVGSTPLDDFLDGSTSSTGTGELLQRVGLVGSMVGITLSIGLLAFLVLVHSGRRSEVTAIVRIVGVAGFLVLVGAVLELTGVASIDDLSWSEALTDSVGAAPMMRMLAGVLILLGLFDQTAPVDPGDDGPVDDATPVRWIPTTASAFALVGLAVGALSFWFDGHTVTEGPRVVHALVNVVHVGAAGVWFGGIFGLLIVGVLRRGTEESTAPLLIRFSSVASVALIGVVLAGSLMTLMIIDGPGDLTSTDWGRLLLVKTAMVVLVAALGGYNHFVVVPALERENSTGAELTRARTTVRVEALLLLSVVVLTVFLTTASTN